MLFRYKATNEFENAHIEAISHVYVRAHAYADSHVYVHAHAYLQFMRKQRLKDIRYDTHNRSCAWPPYTTILKIFKLLKQPRV